MHTYDFVSSSITELQVRQIIKTAGYNPANYTYRRRVDNDGYVVQGTVVMSINHLENAAKSLGIKVEIYSAAAAAALDGSSASLAATPYQITIDMSQATVTALLQGGFSLYGFKAVQTTQKGGAPVVWFKSDIYSTSTQVSWTQQYEAYTSSSQIIPNGQITSSFSTPIDLEQTLQVDQLGGTGSVITGGVPSAISIHNLLKQQYTCGISQVQNGAVQPMCAFPLYGGNLDVIAPIERVLLMFSTNPVNTGTVIVQAYSSGLLIDLTSAAQRSVTYDINLGWGPTAPAWATQVPANADMVPLLIDPSVPVAAFRQQLAVGSV